MMLSCATFGDKFFFFRRCFGGVEKSCVFIKNCFWCFLNVFIDVCFFLLKFFLVGENLEKKSKTILIIQKGFSSLGKKLFFF